MKKNLFLIFIFVSFSSMAQVGIGTTEPTKDLDINGELRIRTVPVHNVGELMVVDPDGNVGKLDLFLLSDIESTQAVDLVVQDATGLATIDNVDLELSTTVTIPANKDALVIITYSVPLGLSSNAPNPYGYYGIRFLRNGIEAEGGSRKSSIIPVTTAAYSMITLSNTFTESFAADPSERSITYSLNGYIEQTSETTGTHTYRFNMWSVTPPNFNWGRATIIKQVYLK